MSIKSVPNVDIQDEGSILSFYPAQNDAGTDEEIVEVITTIVLITRYSARYINLKNIYSST